MNTKPDQPEPPEADLGVAQDRILELEQELEAASDIINEQQVQIECLRSQLEDADLKIDEGEAARRKLEQRVADLEDALADEPCPVPVSKDQRRPKLAALAFKPYPPERLKATPTDIAALEAVVGRLGWEEFMYHVGMMLAKHASEAQGPHKGALEVAASLVNLWGPSFYWCNEEVCRALEEQENRRISRRRSS